MSVYHLRSLALALCALACAGRVGLAGEGDAACAQCESGPCFLAKIPYLGRLFKNGGAVVAEVKCEACPSKCEGCPAAQTAKTQSMLPRTFHFVGPDGVERIGVDFDIQLQSCEEACAGGKCTKAQSPEGKVIAHRRPCPECEQVIAAPAPHEFIEALMAAAGGQAASEVVLEAHEELFSALDEARSEFAEREHELMEQVMEARIEAATLKAKLKAQKEIASKETSLRKELVSAQLENARLAAKLELATEKAQLAAELRQAQLELVTLKAQTEVAALKAQLQSQPSNAAARKGTDTLR